MASKPMLLPIFSFDNSPWRVGASWWRANVPLCLFFPLITRHCELGAS